MSSYSSLDSLLYAGPIAVYQASSADIAQSGADLLQNSVNAAQQTMLNDQSLIQNQTTTPASQVSTTNGGDGGGGKTSYLSWSTDSSGNQVATLVQDVDQGNGQTLEMVSHTTYYGSNAPSGFPTNTTDPSYTTSTDASGNQTERWQDSTGQIYTKYTASGGTVTYSVTTAPISTSVSTGQGQADQYYSQNKSSATTGDLTFTTTEVTSKNTDPLTTMAAVFQYSETYAQAQTTISTYLQCSIDAFKSIPH